MREIKFRVWHKPEKKMYYRGYQKLLHVLLCDDDRGENAGKGLPVKKAGFEDCDMLECTDIIDIHDRLVFEGDRLNIVTETGSVQVTVKSIPDMFRSRGLHPLQESLSEIGLTAEQIISCEIIGNIYETEIS